MWMIDASVNNGGCVGSRCCWVVRLRWSPGCRSGRFIKGWTRARRVVCSLKYDPRTPRIGGSTFSWGAGSTGVSTVGWGAQHRIPNPE